MSLVSDERVEELLEKEARFDAVIAALTRLENEPDNGLADGVMYAVREIRTAAKV